MSFIHTQRRVLIAFCVLALLITGLSVHLFATDEWADKDVDIASASIPLSKVLRAVNEEVQRSIATYDADQNSVRLGINLGNVTPAGYEQSLKHIHETFLAPSPVDLESVLAHLSPIPRKTAPLPKHVHTTDIASSEELPEQFNSWSSVNKGWTTTFMADADMDAWLEDIFTPSHPLVMEMRALRGQWGIVRADSFRYLVLFLLGGVYTDTDTACVRPIEQWAKSSDKFDRLPLQAQLPMLLSIAEGRDFAQEREPSMIIAIEADAFRTKTDWRKQTFVRGIQIVQWTILSKPRHPILLDVIGHALSTARDMRERTEQGHVSELPSVLDWSGPGAFTDAVLRYLLVRYGVHPQDLSRLNRPRRFGDVMVMPSQSFRAGKSEGYQGENKVVWHGFRGRWKVKPPVSQPDSAQGIAG